GRNRRCRPDNVHRSAAAGTGALSRPSAQRAPAVRAYPRRLPAGPSQLLPLSPGAADRRLEPGGQRPAAPVHRQSAPERPVRTQPATGAERHPHPVPVPHPRTLLPPQPGAGSACPQGRQAPAATAGCGSGQSAALPAGGGCLAGAARPRDAGAVLLFRPAPGRAGGPGPGAAGPASGRGAGHGQGQPGAHSAGWSAGTRSPATLAGGEAGDAGTGASGVCRPAGPSPARPGHSAAGPPLRHRSARPAPAPAHAAPLLRQPPAGILRRPARRAGAARPQRYQHHPGVHSPELPASGRGVRQGAPPGQTPHQGLIRTMIQLLTFDLDNTLWETEPVVAAAEQTLLEWLDRHAPRFTRQFDAQARRALRGEVLAVNPELRHRVTALRIAVLEHGLRKAGYSPEQAGELALAGFEVFLEARHALTFFPHCEPLLEELARHYQLATISNGNADVRRLGLEKYFRVIVSADEVGLSKPD